MASSSKSGDPRPTRNGRRVAPAPRSCDDIVEIRPGRTIRIRHLNPKQRDAKFAKEMEVYLQARQNGLLGGVFMPPKTSQGNKSSTNVNEAAKSTVSLNYKQEGLDENKVNINDWEDKENTIAESEPSNPLSSRSKKSVTSIKHDDTDTDKGFKGLESTENEAKVWVSRTVSRQADLISPSRVSAAPSSGVQSASGIHVSVSRPSSEVTPMTSVAESKTKVEGLNLADNESPIPESVHSSRSPRKTKGHRPISAKNIRGAKSLASSEQDDTIADLSDFGSAVSFKESSFKDVTLFFIHGVGGSAEIWNAQLDFFASLGIEVVAPDLLGHGFSSCPNKAKDYSFNEILADVEAVFDKYCKRQNIVIAHSYGCAFAAVLGRRRARRVSKLVLISGGAPIPLAPQPGVFSLPLCCLSCIKPCIFSSFERGAFHAKNSGVTKELAFDVPTYVLSHMMHGQLWPDGDELYHRWLSMPVLLLHGKYDKFITVEEEIEMSKAIYYSHLEVIDNASHMVMMEAPKHVNQLLYDFVFQELGVLTQIRDFDGEIPFTARTARGTKIAA